LKTLKLDFINKDVINEYINNKERVLQQIKLAVQVWKGDWMLDEEFGIDYDSSWGNTLTMSTYIQSQIKQVSGVSSIISFSIEKNTIEESNIEYFVDAQISFENEILIISEGI